MTRAVMSALVAIIAANTQSFFEKFNFGGKKSIKTLLGAPIKFKR